ncbi:hypothetical protein [Halodesulfovibrio sp.]|jgi:hypothetical protein|uniref:hypothetical protein n=1 Tax=Halodesulfovibrio sp. TaxID=1912772 RepID=UPI0025D59883|nr:hypothetical protein [Halodesulfovibrio sp.]MCT4534195.1 hypothetical protein [Halodesulfovibrio sp.]
MHSLTDCENTIKSVLEDSPYNQNYVWNKTTTSNYTENVQLDRADGLALTLFIAEILQDNNAPCVEEVIGLLEEFIQESSATEKTALLDELSAALNAAC